jgi:diaminopimelate decarboxylase
VPRGATPHTGAAFHVPQRKLIFFDAPGIYLRGAFFIMEDIFSPLLTAAQASDVRKLYGTPAYVYSEAVLRRRAAEALAFPVPFGLKVRFAIKACPNAAILRLFASMGICFDASSGFEAERLILAGIAPESISLSSQEMPANLKELVGRGVRYDACSLRQLEEYGRLFPSTALSIRVNPGVGSGHSQKVNVGGAASSFGIWHERLPEVMEVCSRYKICINVLHTHIGSGADPEVWERVARLNLEMVRKLPEVATINMGGGFKIARVPGEKQTDLHKVGVKVARLLEGFAAETGRKLALEIEPGTFLAAQSGGIVATVQDLACTGEGGYHFLKLDTGMTDILRPSLYGAQHAIRVYPASDTGRTQKYLVAGHCCETGDMLTPAPGNSEGLLPRELPEAAIGDICVIEGAGAYCAAMPAKNYNSFPESPEVLLHSDGTLSLIRRRQSLAQMIANEVTERQP